MSSIDSSILARVFFGISLIVFLITLYIILPAFLFNKRTVLRPELINAMWYRIYDASIGKLKNSLTRFKKKEDRKKAVKLDMILPFSTLKKKIRLGLYEH